MKRSLSPGAAVGGLKSRFYKLIRKILFLFWIGACFISWEQNSYDFELSLIWPSIKNFGVIIIEVSGIADVASEKLQAARDYLAGLEGN